MILRSKPDLLLAKTLTVCAWILTAVVLIAVGMMRQIAIHTSVDFSILPAVNAVLNSCTAILLLVAYWYVRHKQYGRHRNAIYVAMVLSFGFLTSYVLYHFTTVETPFCREGWIRPVYFVILISHVVLAGVIFPFILFTFIRAFTGQYARHRRMARWVIWIWLYVAVTGPLVYLMLSPCY